MRAYKARAFAGGKERESTGERALSETYARVLRNIAAVMYIPARCSHECDKDAASAKLCGSGEKYVEFAPSTRHQRWSREMQKERERDQSASIIIISFPINVLDSN